MNKYRCWVNMTDGDEYTGYMFKKCVILKNDIIIYNKLRRDSDDVLYHFNLNDDRIRLSENTLRIDSFSNFIYEHDIISFNYNDRRFVGVIIKMQNRWFIINNKRNIKLRLNQDIEDIIIEGNIMESPEKIYHDEYKTYEI